MNYAVRVQVAAPFVDGPVLPPLSNHGVAFPARTMDSGVISYNLASQVVEAEDFPVPMAVTRTEHAAVVERVQVPLGVPDMSAMLHLARDAGSMPFMPEGIVRVIGSATTNKRKRPKKPKDPLAPKRSLTAFMFFSNERRPIIKRDFPDISFTDVGVRLGIEWGELEPAERERYERLASEDKERYNKLFAQYVASRPQAAAEPPPPRLSEEDDEQPAAKRMRRDPLAPRLPLSGFEIFELHVRYELSKTSDPSPDLIRRVAMEKWKTAQSSDRLPYVLASRVDKQRYDRDQDAYLQKFSATPMDADPQQRFRLQILDGNKRKFVMLVAPLTSIGSLKAQIEHEYREMYGEDMVVDMLKNSLLVDFDANACVGVLLRDMATVFAIPNRARFLSSGHNVLEFLMPESALSVPTTPSDHHSSNDTVEDCGSNMDSPVLATVPTDLTCFLDRAMMGAIPAASPARAMEHSFPYATPDTKHGLTLSSPSLLMASPSGPLVPQHQLHPTNLSDFLYSAALPGVSMSAAPLPAQAYAWPTLNHGFAMMTDTAMMQ